MIEPIRNNMKDRIQRLIDDKNLTPSRFADEVGLNRPAVSHILNGRNNPSMDALQKILKRFPEISGSWLLTGEGSMYQFNTERDSPTLFDENPVNTPNRTAENEYAQDFRSKSPEKAIQQIDYQSLIPTKSRTVKVKKIAIFYSDNTYEEFIPAQKE
ncbi:MAG TPA: transcriptional regulator [Bacteroidales bacterium]|nr:transcriptional regulator [Bacteroidales bacterium]